MENEEPEYVKPAASNKSDTRTKIATFSYNDCSIEIINGFTQLTTLGYGINGDMENNNKESLLEPPDFEKVAKVQSEHDVTQCPGVNMKCQPAGLNSISLESTEGNHTDGKRSSEKSNQELHGFEKLAKIAKIQTGHDDIHCEVVNKECQSNGHNSTPLEPLGVERTDSRTDRVLRPKSSTIPTEGLGENDNVESPPGFEKFRTAKLSKQTPKSQQHSVERRMTRSRMQMEKSSSQVTTESMRKLAEKSLAIGEILGIKIIAGKKEATRRITDSLKVEKKRKSNLN